VDSNAVRSAGESSMMNGLLRAMYSSRGGREEHTATAAHIHHRIYEVRY